MVLEYDMVEGLRGILERKSFTPSLEDRLVGEEVIVFSDTHLGLKRGSNAEEFRRFLSYLVEEVRKRPTAIVVNGDFIELWTRDDFVVLMENLSPLEQLYNLAKKNRVYWVVGNHDYRFKDFTSCLLPICVRRQLILKDGDASYRFVHGDQYDPTQVEFFYPLLCERSDEITGEFLSKIGGRLLSAVRKAYPRLNEQFKEGKREMLKTPEERGIREIVEENARRDRKRGEFLIFSHTHRAFVNEDEGLANPGCWMEGHPNTYLKVRRGRIKLEEF